MNNKLFMLWFEQRKLGGNLINNKDKAMDSNIKNLKYKLIDERQMANGKKSRNTKHETRNLKHEVWNLV